MRVNLSTGGVATRLPESENKNCCTRRCANSVSKPSSYGHDHVFVDEVVDGIHYALPGSCGAPWKFGREVTGYRRHWTDSGHARLSVRPELATVEFVNQAGQVLHEFVMKPGQL